MKHLLFFAFCLLLSATAATAQSKKIESIYTGTAAKDCKPAPDSADGDYKGICPGVGGYRLELLEGDLRQTVNVLAGREKFELNLWGNVSGGFSSVGQKAEWRVTRSGRTVTPLALILRFNASEDPEDSTKVTSYLVVVKLSKSNACITDIIKPAANQNELARQAADSVQPCKTFE